MDYELHGNWKNISEDARNGKKFEIGNYKQFKMKDGRLVTMVITDATAEYIRFESRDCVGEEIPWNEDGHEVSFPDSSVYRYLNGELFDLLPEDLKESISPAKRHYQINGSDTIYESKLFLPAQPEVYGSYSPGEELYQQMDYYKDRRNRMRIGRFADKTGWYWLDSVTSSESNGGFGGVFCVNSDGFVELTYPGSYLYVPLCFNINRS